MLPRHIRNGILLALGPALRPPGAEAAGAEVVAVLRAPP
jgi:hypothetical protein